MFLALMLAAAMIAPTAHHKPKVRKTHRAEVTVDLPHKRELIKELIHRGLTEDEANLVIRDPKLREPLIIPERKKKVLPSWQERIRMMLTPEEVKRGTDFMQEQQEALARANKKYGIPPEVGAALTRVESDFGQFLGQYEVYKVLFQNAISLRYQHWDWAVEWFAALTVYCRNTGTDCYSFRGSYSGAMGYTQFMPRALEQYGVSFANDCELSRPNDSKKCTVDLYHHADAIMSMARFLRHLGWDKDPAKALSHYCSINDRVYYPIAVLAYAKALGLNIEVPPMPAPRAAAPKLAKTRPKKNQRKPVPTARLGAGSLLILLILIN